jgi:hypothetical protein
MGDWNPPEIDGWTDGMPIPVTDQFGNIKDWVPYNWNGGSGSTELRIILLVLLAVYIFIIYPIFDLVRGIRAWNAGYRRYALRYFVVPLIYASVYLLYQFSDVASQAMAMKAQESLQELQNNPPSFVTEVRRCETQYDSPRASSCDREGTATWFLNTTVTNNISSPIEVWVKFYDETSTSQGLPVWCDAESLTTIKSGKTRNIACSPPIYSPDKVPKIACLKYILAYGQDVYSAGQICKEIIYN